MSEIDMERLRLRGGEVFQGNDTIRSPEAFRSILPFGELRECFEYENTGIYPQDIDGEVERNGHFLWLEWKHESQLVPNGQIRSIRARIEMARFYGTAMVIWHASPLSGRVRLKDTRSICVFRFSDSQNKCKAITKFNCDSQRMMKWCSAWYQMANGDSLEFFLLCRHLIGDCATKPPRLAEFWG